MERLLLDNLAKNQAFDQVLRQGSPLRRIVEAYIAAILLQADEKKRREAIPLLEAAIVAYFARTLQPAARELGQTNARQILTKITSQGVKPDLNDPDLRRRVLIDGAYRPAVRVQIVKSMVNDRANTLENRLSAYWLEPGQNQTAKLNRLVQIHTEQMASEKRYQDELAKFYKQERDSRPAKPRLEFVDKFTNETTQDLREQARRAGTDAETATFEKAGFQQLSWVTVNASEACPDCRKLQGVTGDASFWNQKGRPGSGHTVCKSACFCMLVPAKTLHVAPDLAARGLDTHAASQLTHAGMHAGASK